MGRNSLEDQKKALEIETEINSTLAQRNALLKGQARGYLDAITAQAFGAGRFSKIIISQDRNLAKALETGMAERNTFLGKVGTDALRTQVSPFQYSGRFNEDMRNALNWSNQIRGQFGGQMPEMPLPAMTPYQRDTLTLPKVTPAIPTVTPPQPERPQPESSPPPRPKQSQSTSLVSGAVGHLRAVAHHASKAADELETDERQVGVTPLAYQSVMTGQF